MSPLSSSRKTPSITSWTRLEPDPHDPTLSRALQAQVRDAAWLLGRQWQMGEFQGDDAGSPVQATIGYETRHVTSYRPGYSDVASVSLDVTIPLETHVEREAVTLGLRGSVRLGIVFERFLRLRVAAGSVATVISDFRASFPIAATDSDPLSASGTSLRTLANARVVDGVGVVKTTIDLQAGRVPAVPLPPSASAIANVDAAIADLLSYYGRLYNLPAADDAWQARPMRYAFGVGSPTVSDTIGLAADAFAGGHLDWYAFSLEPQPQLPATIPTSSDDFTEATLLPNHVVFRGMPEGRWWTFEDDTLDFGQLDAQHVDLAKLLVMEFALVYGNDWFVIPLKSLIGDLSRVTGLIVTDTFGERTIVNTAETTSVTPGERPWSMYKIGNATQRSDFVWLAPTVTQTIDGDALEDVFFLRDDMAAMAWAVEHQLPGPLDDGIDAYAAYLERIKREAPPPPAPIPAGVVAPDIDYVLETTVPDNWIPLVPVRTPDFAPLLRRGQLVRATGATFVANVARAEILEPWHPLFIDDRIVPREGREVTRRFRRARWTDGSTYLWLGRESRVGRGPGYAGLQFDLVRKQPREVR
jgi:hypothetical protein